MTGKHIIADLLATIARYMTSRYGPPSEWRVVYSKWLSGRPDFYDDMAMPTLPSLLGDCFSSPELRAIFSSVWRKFGTTIRSQLPSRVAEAFPANQSPDAIAARLTSPDIIQILLLRSDEELATAIDELIDDGTIAIPSGEIRQPRTSYVPVGAFSPLCQCSILGIRSKSSGDFMALQRLRRLILRTYKDDTAGLAHRLRFAEGSTVGEKLDNFVLSEDPRELVGRVIDLPDGLAAIADTLRGGAFPRAESPEDEARVRNRTLWKLGFDAAPPADTRDDLKDRSRRLMEVASGGNVADATTQEDLRSVGANLFVDLERFLDRALCFACWILLADHYATSYRYDLQAGRDLVAGTLASLGPSTLTYNANGRNTLFALVHGFAGLANVCDSARAAPHESERPRDSWPDFAGRTDARSFPYAHTKAVLDLRDPEVEQCLALLRESTSRLDRGLVIQVRNGIDHDRATFPSATDVRAATDALLEVVKSLTSFGLVATVYHFGGERVDEFQRRLITMRDDRGREVILRSPTLGPAPGLPAVRSSQLLVPSFHVGATSDIVRFVPVEASSYFPLKNEPLEP